MKKRIPAWEGYSIKPVPTINMAAKQKESPKHRGRPKKFPSIPPITPPAKDQNITVSPPNITENTGRAPVDGTITNAVVVDALETIIGKAAEIITEANNIKNLLNLDFFKVTDKTPKVNPDIKIPSKKRGRPKKQIKVPSEQPVVFPPKEIQDDSHDPEVPHTEITGKVLLSK
jgi:hypothetical protein